MAALVGLSLGLLALPASAATAFTTSTDPLGLTAEQTIGAMQRLLVAPADHFIGGGVVLADAATAGDPATAAPPLSPRRQAAAEYVRLRRSLATLVAGRVGSSANALDAVWARTDATRLTAVYAALSQVGTKYRRLGNDPSGFDCSGLTSFAWSKAGLVIARNSESQIRATNPRTASELAPGDLVYRPGHIMMYVGTDDVIVHASQTGRPILVAHWGRTKKFGSPVPADVAAQAVYPTPAVADRTPAVRDVSTGNLQP